MVTRRKPVQNADENGNMVLMPVNSHGQIVQGAGAWQMPVGDDAPADDVDFDSLPETPEQTAADRVLTMLKDSGSDASAKIELYRTPQAGRKLMWLDTITPEDYERGGLKFISEKWGGGEYELRLYATSADGQYGLRTRVSVSIEAPRPNPVANVQQDSALSQALAQMAAQQADMMRVLSERPPPVDPMAQMTQMFTMMKLMKEATGETAAPKSSISEVIDAIKEMRGVSELMGGGKDDSDNPMSMLKDLLPVIQAGLAAKGQQPAQIAAPPQQSFPPVGYVPNPAPVPQAQPGAPDMPYDPNAPQDEQIAKLQKSVASLLMLASMDMPASAGAVIVYEELPDELISVLERDDWWSQFVMMEPKAAPFQEWFTRARDEALAMFDEPEEPAQNVVAAAPAVSSLEIVKEVSNESVAKPASKSRKAAPAARVDPAA